MARGATELAMALPVAPLCSSAPCPSVANHKESQSLQRHMEFRMSRIPVQVASPEIGRTAVPGPAAVLTEDTRKWAIPSPGKRNAENPEVAMRRAPGRFLSNTLALAALLLAAAGVQAQTSFGSQPDGTASASQSVTV